VNEPSLIADIDPSSPAYDAADETDAVSAATGKVKRLGDVWRALKWTSIMFLIGEAGNALVAAARIAVLSGFGGAASLDDNAARIEAVRDVVAYIYFGGFFLAAFAYLWFVFRAMSNLIKFSPRFIRGSGASAVIWHFVPLVCLAKPYAIMSQLWVQPYNPSATGGKASPFIGWWWMCWLASGVMIAISLAERRIAADTYGAAERLELIVRDNVAVLFGALLTIASILFLLPVTKAIARAQDDQSVPAAFDA
jgi:hypothetical protein